VPSAVAAETEKSRSHEHRRPPLWLADQLLEPTKLVFAIVIAESLREYRVVLTSPIRDGHYIASLALVGIYLTTVWSWLGWHKAHERYPYIVYQDHTKPPEPNQSETFRFYADLAIVIAYAYTLFQVEPLIADPTHNLVWLLIGYPMIIGLYVAETQLRRMHYGGEVRRLVPLSTALAAFVAVTIGYVLAREALTPVPRGSHDLLWLNGVTLAVVIVLMWAYRRFNDYYKARLAANPTG
jgi:hypothetical protein